MNWDGLLKWLINGNPLLKGLADGVPQRLFELWLRPFFLRILLKKKLKK